MGIFGTITGFKAVGAKKLRVEFDSAVPEASKATLSIKKGKSDVKGTPIWTDGDKAVTYVTEGFLQQGKYTASVNGGEGKEVDVQAEEVKEIVIKNKDNILTGTSSSSKQEGRSNDEAYIYYDVKNQYDESIRERTTINWSITSCDAKRDNKSLGLVVAHRKNDREIFTYGSKLDVTAVCIKDGQTKTGHEVVTIGQIQAIDKVQSKGFVKRAAKGRKLDWEKDKRDLSREKVPADFPKKTWALMYEAYDQNGDILEPAKDNLTSATEGAKLTFVSGTPTCIMNDFADGEIYAIMEKQDDGTTVEKEYSSVTIEPGAYIDRESKVKLSAISTRTGYSSDKEFDIGYTPVLKSFKMEIPSFVVADGDTDVNIPFTAEDMNGEPVTSYKTIARSSNTLNLTASEGTLTLKEDKDGKAVLSWNDAPKYCQDTDGDNVFNPYDMYKNNGIMINDGIDRTISLTAVVTGETGNTQNSNTTRLPVSDMRRPASIEDVRFGRDGNDMVIAGVDQKVNVATGIIYTDQYGIQLSEARSNKFWEAAKDGNIRGYNYSIRVNQLSGSHPIFGDKYNTGNTTSNTSGSASDTAQDQVNNNYGGVTGSADSSTAVNADVINLKANTPEGNNVPLIYHNAIYSTFDTVKTGIGSDVLTDANGKPITDVNGNILYTTKHVGIEEVREVAQATVKYSLVESEKTGNSRYNDIGKASTETYTIVPIEDVSDFSIETRMPNNKLFVETVLSDAPNGSFNANSNAYNYGDIDPNSPIYNKSKAVTSYAIGINSNVKEDKDNVKINNISVKAKYRNTPLTVPSKYVESTNEGPWGVNSKVVSGSSLKIGKDSDGYGMYIDKINYNAKETGVSSADMLSGEPITWSDLYDVNSARYTRRKDAQAKLELFISRVPSKYYKENVSYTAWDYNLVAQKKTENGSGNNSVKNWQDENGNWIEIINFAGSQSQWRPVSQNVGATVSLNNGIVISKSIGISDERPTLNGIVLLSDGYIAPNKTEINSTNVGVTVLDQYGQQVSDTDSIARKVLFTVTDYNENPDGRLDDNYKITNNGYDNSKITGAELGDTYTLTANISNTGITKTIKMTVGADKAAKIVSNKSMTESTEYDLRYNHLGYNR